MYRVRIKFWRFHIHRLYIHWTTLADNRNLVDPVTLEKRWLPPTGHSELSVVNNQLKRQIVADIMMHAAAGAGKSVAQAALDCNVRLRHAYTLSGNRYTQLRPPPDCLTVQLIVQTRSGTSLEVVPRSG